MALDALDADPVSVRRVIDVHRRRRVVCQVDEQVPVGEAGLLQAVVQRVRCHLDETLQIRQRVVLQPPSLRRQAVDQPVDGPLILRAEPRLELLDGPLTGMGPSQLRVGEVL